MPVNGEGKSMLLGLLKNAVVRVGSSKSFAFSGDPTRVAAFFRTRATYPEILFHFVSYPTYVICFVLFCFVTDASLVNAEYFYVSLE